VTWYDAAHRDPLASAGPPPSPTSGSQAGSAGSVGSVAVPRRDVVQALGGLGLAGVVVTFASGCASAQPQSAPSVAAQALAALSPAALTSIKGAITADEVGVGKAIILGSAGVILSRPTPTTYRVFSTVCTHQGATITTVTADGKLQCPLHGSTFDPVSGAALIGPAGKPLAGRDVTVQGDTVSLS
jgi:Rieske Fe-S protein